MLKIYFRRVVDANSSLFSIIVSYHMEIIWIPIQLLKHPQELCILGKRSLKHCLYPGIKYLPKHVCISLSVSLITMCSGHSQCWLFIIQSFFCSKPSKKLEQEEKMYHFFTSQVLGNVGSMPSTRGVFVLRKSLEFI